MTGPHVDQTGRDALEDRGLVDDDHTEEMRKPPADTRGLQFQQIEPSPTITKEQFR